MIRRRNAPLEFLFVLGVYAMILIACLLVWGAAIVAIFKELT